jgi:chromosomal replication initiator protein
MTKHEAKELITWLQLNGINESESPEEVAEKYYKECQCKIRSTADNIYYFICSYAGLEPEKLKDITRKREVIELRQLAMYFIKKKTNLSLNQIGYFFHSKNKPRGFDHASCLHNIKVVENLICVDKIFYKKFKEIEELIK